MDIQPYVRSCINCYMLTCSAWAWAVVPLLLFVNMCWHIQRTSWLASPHVGLSQNGKVSKVWQTAVAV